MTTTADTAGTISDNPPSDPSEHGFVTGVVEPKAETALAANPVEEANLMALGQIIKEGKAIIDGGATSSLGSEDALQQIAVLNWEKHGDDGIEIVPDDKPAFRFGNNGRHECMSTALLKLAVGEQESKVRIHLHDIPQQPVLLSVKGLRALGAVIDFDRNEAIFKRIDPAKVAVLETTASGHQLFPLVGNVLENARRRRSPFKSLGEDCDEPVSHTAKADE